MIVPGKYYPASCGQGFLIHQLIQKKLYFSEDRFISIIVNNGLMFVDCLCNQLKLYIFFCFCCFFGKIISCSEKFRRKAAHFLDKNTAL